MTDITPFVMVTPIVANLWQSYIDSNITGQGIVLFQVLLSMVVWALMLGKAKELFDIRRYTKAFRYYFTKSSSTLELFFQEKQIDYPIYVVYRTSCEKLIRELSGDDPSAIPNQRAAIGRTLRPASIELIKSTLEETLAEQQERLESKMGFIAIGASIAPLIGLLGTVLGVLDAFQAMGAKGSALLSEVAPGISSALLTTVLGLAIAIPSAFGYNWLLSKIRPISIKMDGFADELLARISLEFGKRD